MRSKNDVPEEDVEEMIEEYKAQKKHLDEIRPIILYRGQFNIFYTFHSNLFILDFISMLQFQKELVI